MFSRPEACARTAKVRKTSATPPGARAAEDMSLELDAYRVCWFKAPNGCGVFIDAFVAVCVECERASTVKFRDYEELQLAGGKRTQQKNVQCP